MQAVHEKNHMNLTLITSSYCDDSAQCPSTGGDGCALNTLDITYVQHYNTNRMLVHAFWIASQTSEINVVFCVTALHGEHVTV